MRLETRDWGFKKSLVSGLWSPVLIILVGILVYSNSFQGVFLFDDHGEITDDEKIQSLSWPWPFMENVRRPILYLSLAINYALGQYNPFGYHIFNLIVHILAALFLFGIVRRTCLLLPDYSSLKKEALPFAFLSAMVWLVHPLQTQSITYVIQRAESLMGMFYLFSIYAAIRYMEGREQACLFPTKAWLVVSIFACLLSGLTKEVAITAPLIILLYDRTFISQSFREALKKHRWLYAGLSLTWIIMIFLLFTTHPEKTPTAGFAYKGISLWQYALTQPEVILYYLKLAVWPHPLVLDYEWPSIQNFGQALLPLFALFLSLNLMLGSFLRGIWYRPLGFLGMSFFIILLPSSSFIPLKDIAFEHRMYLPLACVVILVLLALRSLLKKKIPSENLRKNIIILASIFIVGILGFLTFERNKDYHNEAVMWKDVIDKRPQNARAHNNYGKYLATTMSGKEEEARAHYQKAIELKPDYADAYLNMGSILAQLGDFPESVRYSKKAIALEPDYAIAYNNLGAALSQQDQYQEAIICFQKALDLGFQKDGVYRNLGVAFAQTGRPQEAINNLREALRLNPDFKEARDNLNEILRKLKQK